MTSQEYRRLAKRTMNFSLNEKEQLAMLGLGIGGEAGEIVDILKKTAFHGHELDEEKLVKEIGDVMWYLENLLDILNIPMDEVYSKNIEKLAKRYPNGFSEQDSILRKT